ncbi:hypothetical protein V502_01467 [Pseudogymnoascus sp. VKM F-4520 (FW-2644)]|nr:hypothetical protein V502_01467 [Pseudogymnoascus sp. VKM F-4520 (FW-2644)]
MDTSSNKRGTKIDFDAVPASSIPVADDRARSAPPGGTPSSKKRKASPQRRGAAKVSKSTPTAASNEVVTKPGLKSFALVPIAEDGVSVFDSTEIKRESPWDYFREHYELNFGGFVSVASNRVYPHNLFIVKRLKGPDDARGIRLLHTVRHNNFHDMLECFSYEGAYYAVFEHVPISLAHVAKSPHFLTEVELAAILGQILEGLAHLASNGLEHGSLSCSNILLGTDGDIKIAGQERCQELASLDQGHSRDIRALGNITMELMQKYTKHDGAIGVDDLVRWPSDCNAVGFLSMTTSATSVDELLQHPLLQCDWDKVDLKWIVAFAAVASHRGYSYHE